MKDNQPTTFTGVTPSSTNPFSNLPDLMKQILYHEENVDINMAIEQSNNLTRQQGDQMMTVIKKIILKTIKPADLVSTVQTDIGLEAEPARKLALDLLTKRFIAMEWYIGNVRGLIHELGGNVEEALAEAKKLYPEVYAPKQPEGRFDDSATNDEHAILRDFENRIETTKGKAEILLRLTGLSVHVEEAVEAERLNQEEGDRMMRELDAVSYAVNTQDLNPFEVNSIRRKLRKILGQLKQPSA